MVDLYKVTCHLLLGAPINLCCASIGPVVRIFWRGHVPRQLNDTAAYAHKFSLAESFCYARPLGGGIKR